MKFDLEEEGKSIKFRFVALLIAVFVLVAGIIGAFAGIVSSKKNDNIRITSREVFAEKNGETPVDSKIMSRVNANELKMNELESSIKAKDDTISELQHQLKEQSQPPRDDVQNLLVENRQKDSKIEDLQKQLKAFQNINNNRNIDNNSDASKIKDLQKQLKAAQSSNNNNSSEAGKISNAAYQELVSRNKYLDFDVRSLIKSNLQLNKEISLLKKNMQEANNQLKKN